MPDSVRDSIYEAISAIRLVDPHTHINPHDPGSHTLADILGYHYYTELIHSAGMPQQSIEEPGISKRELVRRLVTGLPNIENTANYQWLIEICQTFFDFTDSVITRDNWEALYDNAEQKMNSAQWPQTVLDKSNVESVFLTNDFDDDLQGFDTNTYIPCLRTDDLVFHLGKPETRDRLQSCSGISLGGSLTQLRAALEQRFQHFVASGARACAISIPPSFQPTMVRDGRASRALDQVITHGDKADPAHTDALSRRVFWTIAELCDQYGLPFDLMIGVNRRVYPKGVYQGQDLYDSRVSLIQYRELFNAFPDLKFPVSVLASVTNQELVSYSWIFPNVLTNGHWWYSNTPSFIRRDAAARLEAVPQNKQIGYYSDAYKLEFVLPKFGMYRRILAGILADHFVRGCGWGEERAIELGRRVLRGNVDDIFRSPLEASDDASGEGRANSGAVEIVGGTVADAEPIVLSGANDELSVLEIDGETLDPLPSDDEIKSVQAADVELADATRKIHDADSLQVEIDPMPLEVEGLESDAGTADGSASALDQSEIRMLRGESGFTPSDDELVLQSDPLTGELQFPTPQDGDDPSGTTEAGSESAGSETAGSETAGSETTDDEEDFGLGVF